jgi:hypothetical protein
MNTIAQPLSIYITQMTIFVIIFINVEKTIDFKVTLYFIIKIITGIMPIRFRRHAMPNLLNLRFSRFGGARHEYHTQFGYETQD